MKYLSYESVKHHLKLIPVIIILLIFSNNQNDIFYFIAILLMTYGVGHKALYDIKYSNDGKFVVVSSVLTLVLILILGIPYLIYLLINIKF